MEEKQENLPKKIEGELLEVTTQEAENSHLTEVEKGRAMQQVQAQLLVAKRWPRDEISAEKKIMTACKRPSLAEVAFYRYPKGGEKIEGPSIRFAEMLAQAWGNLSYGFRELERADGRSVVEAFTWDLESNTQAVRTFTVEHKLQLKGGQMKYLKDPRDIYEMVANQAQRRVRACILELIPAEIRDRAMRQAKQTLLAEVKVGPLIDRIKAMAVAFSDYGVTEQHIEARLGHPLPETTHEELVEMLQIFNSIRDGQSKREHWFEIGARPQDSGKAGELNEMFPAPEQTAQAEKKQKKGSAS